MSTAKPRKPGRPELAPDKRRVTNTWSVAKETRDKIRAEAERKGVSEGRILDALAKKLSA